MKLAFILFDDITWLDLIGLYDPLSRLKSLGYMPSLAWDFCARKNSCSDAMGLTVQATRVNKSLESYDAILIPGGHGTRQLIQDAEFLDWIRTGGAAKYKISVCTGSLILGAAGFLKDSAATTHFSEYETLKGYCREVRKQRIVEDGNIITAGAVTSGIDLGLYLCGKWSGADAASKIRSRMDYRG